eukprot:18307_4
MYSWNFSFFLSSSLSSLLSFDLCCRSANVSLEMQEQSDFQESSWSAGGPNVLQNPFSKASLTRSTSSSFILARNSFSWFHFLTTS